MIELILEVRGEVIITANVWPSENLINKKLDYWHNLYGLKNKQYRIYYDVMSKGRNIVKEAA